MRRPLVAALVLLTSSVYAAETTTGSLSALNGTVQSMVYEGGGVGVCLNTANFNGTVVPEMSMGGTYWGPTRFVDYDGQTADSLVFGGTAATHCRTIAIGGAATHVRAKVSVYNSGSVTASLVVSATGGNIAMATSSGGGGDGVILDGTAAGQADVIGSAPSGSEQGLVVRTIPSGTQAVSGTVTAAGPLTDAQLRAAAVPVSGPLTDTQLRAAAVPVSGSGSFTVGDGTGPLTVDGTVASTQSGTWTVTCTNCGGAVTGQTYIANVIASAAGASKDHLSVFNASGSGKILRVLKVTATPSFAAAVTGVAQSLMIARTSTAGATCTPRTIVLTDTTNTAVPAQVTASASCTTDPTVAADLYGCAVSGDETHAMNPQAECYRYQNNGGQPITLREGQGLSVRSSALSGAFPLTVSIEFTM